MYILGQAYDSNTGRNNYGPFILKYSTASKSIVTGSKVKNRQVRLTGSAFEFSFDMKSLFVIGT